MGNCRSVKIAPVVELSQRGTTFHFRTTTKKNLKPSKIKSTPPTGINIHKLRNHIHVGKAIGISRESEVIKTFQNNEETRVETFRVVALNKHVPIRTLSAKKYYDEEDNKWINQYMIIDKISEGGQGSIKKAYDSEDENYCCIRTIDKVQIKRKARRSFRDPETALNNLVSELEVLESLNHKNIFKVTEIIDTEKKCYVITEYIEGKEILTESETEKFFFVDDYQENEIKRIFKQILSAVEYLHKNNIYHRDIKPGNILFRSNKKNDIVLIDFGLAGKFEGDNDLLDNADGTVVFLPPEACQMKENEIRGKPWDMWCLGVLLYAMSYRVVPFWIETENINEIKKLIREKEVTFPENINRSKGLKDLIKKLLNKSMKERLTINEAIHHYWIK